MLIVATQLPFLCFCDKRNLLHKGEEVWRSRIQKDQVQRKMNTEPTPITHTEPNKHHSSYRHASDTKPSITNKKYTEITMSNNYSKMKIDLQLEKGKAIL